MWVNLLFLLNSATSVQSPDDPLDLLRRVSQKIMGTVERLPKYVCTETIERAQYEPTAKHYVRSCDDIIAERRTAHWERRLSFSDRLRLDVAVGVGDDNLGRYNEMYSWPGRGTFDNRGIFNLIPQGAVSTGSFSAFLAAIFGSNSASFTYNGDTAVGGRLLAQFAFRVPVEKSDYTYWFGDRRRQYVTTAYDGTFLVDPKSLDLVRLEIRTSHLPSETGACEATQTLEYSRMYLHGNDFLLPTETRLSILDVRETEAENHTVFSGCHEFHGESTLKFGTLPEVGVPARQRAAPVLTLPPGLPFKVAFTQDIDTANAAAGDPIRAKLKTEIRDSASKVVVPEGSVVTGRIVKIARFYGPSRPRTIQGWGADGHRRSLVIAVKLESLEVGGISQPLKAALDSGVRRFRKVESVTSPHDEIGPIDTSQGLDVGIFEFRDVDSNYVVKSDLESDWVTLVP